MAICHLQIQETVECLRELLNGQKLLPEFQKIQALYLLKTRQLETVTDIANAIGVHRVTVQRWFKKYREQGLSGLLKQGKRTGRPSVISSEVLAQLQQELNNPSRHFQSYGELRDWLQEQQGESFNYKTIYTLVRYRLNTPLKPSKKA